MNERPISFNDEMISAILAGEKQQTRRPLKPQPEGGAHRDFGRWCNGNNARLICKHGAVGDRLWVREAHSIRVTPWALSNGLAWYRRSDIGDMWAGEIRWQPQQRMPRWASRILLEITSIRIERLHDISQEDAKAEGFKKPLKTPDIKYALDDYLVDERTSFAECWDGIYSTWSENPWVWVIGFKVLSTQPQWEAKA
ncbi:hypothetical protein [Shewanella sp.]|uniref:hypothetical protein n=1 Tax=Shewanella sp. TaxID=50422 RepID=UPI003A970E7F